MSKLTKGWAIIVPDRGNRVIAVGMTQYEAWENAGRNDGYPASTLENSGYRCIRVTITEEPTDE